MDRAIQPDSASERESRLDWNLRNWARWMRSDAAVRTLSAIGMALHYGRSEMYSQALEDMEDEADVRSAQAVDAIVRGLPPAQSCALHHVYLHAVFRFPRDNLDELLAAARVTIEAGLDARGMY